MNNYRLTIAGILLCLGMMVVYEERTMKKVEAKKETRNLQTTASDFQIPMDAAISLEMKNCDKVHQMIHAKRGLNESEKLFFGYSTGTAYRNFSCPVNPEKALLGLN